MERFSSRTIDELGRIVIHIDLRRLLILETGDKVSLTLVGTLVIMQRVEDCSEDAVGPVCALSTISELGMIKLPAEFRKRLGWEAKEKVALYHTDNMVIMKSAS